MNDKRLSIIGILAFAALVGTLCVLIPQPVTAPHAAETVIGAIDALPATGAGNVDSTGPATVYMGGTAAQGRVSQLYVKAAENLFIAVDQAPRKLLESPDRWVEVEFPELLANGSESARAMITSAEAGIQVGDVVEIKFAHKDNLRFFPVKEVTRVTSLVAHRDEMIAKDFERRILARNGQLAPEDDVLTRVLGLPRKTPGAQYSSLATTFPQPH
jgi:hypothetical protein